MVLITCLFYFYLDRYIVDFFSQYLNPWLRGFSLVFSVLAEQLVVLSGLFLSALALRRSSRRVTFEVRAWFLFFSVLIPILIALVLKIAFGRARPELWLSDHLFGFYGLQWEKLYWSFPSGHVTTMTALCAGLFFLFPRYTLLWILTMCCVMIARVFLLKHYLSDVVMTCYLTWLELFLVWKGLLSIPYFKPIVRVNHE